MLKMKQELLQKKVHCNLSCVHVYILCYLFSQYYVCPFILDLVEEAPDLKPHNEETHEEGEEVDENTAQTNQLEGQAESELLEDPTLKEHEVLVCLIIVCVVTFSACVTHF